MTKQPIKLPEHLREQITRTVARYAAFHDRPVDDELLWAMAAKIVEVSGFVRCNSEENEAEFTKLCTEFTQDILRDIVRYGCCWSESVLLTGTRRASRQLKEMPAGPAHFWAPCRASGERTDRCPTFPA
jgi:hypothetical protein